MPEKTVDVEQHPLLEDEANAEQEDTRDHFLEDSPTSPISSSVHPSVTAPPAPVAQTQKDPITVEVERVLEAGLGELYAGLPESARPLFKQKGEEAANEISFMVRQLKIEVRHALELIRDWLLTIPGVNKFFLEQEAKIKVDLLVQLVEERKRERTNL